ncbi:MAG TPA: hypothetical protein VF095_06200 [Bacillota bacterium]
MEHKLLREYILQLEKHLMSYDYKELDELTLKFQLLDRKINIKAMFSRRLMKLQSIP